MFIKEVLSNYVLTDIEPLDSEVLLSHVLGKKRDFLVAHAEEVVPDVLWQHFLSLLEKRKRGVPLAYLIKEKEFYGLPFYVDERVLIPRPETELLVEVVKQIIVTENSRRFMKGRGEESLSSYKVHKVYKENKYSNFRIIDMGTGSGCIGVTLAKLWPEALLTVTDISKQALEVARINAKRHGVEERMVFEKSDLLAGFAETSQPSFAKASEGRRDVSTDIIVANLPYIGTEEYDYVAPEVKEFEPKQALFAGKDGLELYRRLFRQIAELSVKPRYVIGEFGDGQGDEVRSMIQSYFSEKELDIKRDLAGIERAFVLRL